MPTPQRESWRETDAELFRLLVETVSDYAIFILDPGGYVATWNPGAERIKGYLAEEIIGRHFSQFYPQEAIDRDFPNYELQVAGRDGRFEDEGWRVRKDGSQFWANVVITAIRDEEGQLRGFSKITRDMTDRRAAEENARRLIEEAAARKLADAAQERIEVTLASIGDAVVSTDAEGRVDFLNPVAEQLIGRSSSEACGRPLDDVLTLIKEDAREPVKNLASRVLRHGQNVDRVNHTLLITADGVERPVEYSASPIRNSENAAIGAVFILRDVTEKRRSERRLQASEARKSAVLETALDAIITMDHQGRIVEFNPAAEAMFGYDRQSLIGQTLADYIIPPEFRDQHYRGLSRYLQTGEAAVLGRRLLLPALRSDGTQFPAELAITRISSDGPPLFTAYLRDLTEQQRAERHRNARMAVTHALAVASTADAGVVGVLEAVCDNLGWEIGLWWTVDEETSTLICRDSHHSADAAMVTFHDDSRRRRFSKGIGLPGRVWATEQPIWVLDITHDQDFPRLSMALAAGLQSGFACPVMGEGRMLGVVEFFSRRAEPSDGSLLEMMGTVTGAMGQFLQRRRAEDHLREQTANAETLLRIGNLLAQELDLHRLVQVVTDESTQLCGAQFGAFFHNVTGDGNDSYMLYTVSGVPREAFSRFPMPRATDLFGPTFRGEGIVRIDDVTTDPRYGKNDPYRGMPKGHLPVKSYLAVPVISRSGEVLGGLFFGHAEPGVFTAVHERLLASIAGQAAVAIDNARLYRRSRTSESRFRGLMEQAPFSVQLCSPDGKTLSVNRAWEQLWGITLEQVADYNILEDRQLAERGVLPLIQGAFAGEPAFVPAIPYDVRQTTPDRPDGYDSIKWVGAVVYPLKDDDGNVREVVVVHDDSTARMRAENAMRESEEKLRLLADSIPQLAWMAQPDGHVFWYNRRWYEYTGSTAEQVEGWGWQELHDPDVLPRVLEQWQHSIASGEPFDMVFPLRSADGRFRPFLTRVNPLRDSSGNVLYWFGTNTDITELREAREALADSEERLRLALDAGRMGVWDWNIRTGELDWSDSLEPLHGLAPGSFGGTFEHFQDLIHPDDRETVNVAIRRAVHERGDFYVEFRSGLANNGVRWIAGSGKVFLDEDGKPLRMIGVGMDVTSRRRGENTARFLADASAALAVLVDFDSTLQKVAAMAVPHFADWAAVDVLDDEGGLRRVAVAHLDDDKVEMAHELHRRFPPDRDAPTGAWNILRSGQAELVPLIDDDLLVRSIKAPEALALVRQLGLKSYIGVPLTVRGKTIGVLTFIVAESGYCYDATDLSVAQDLASRAAIAIDNSQLYRELREADRRKDEFLATLAHELRNPLAPIRNGLQVLKLAGGEGALITEARTMMERQLGQMVRLVDDLLDVSRITRNKLELRKERVSLTTVVQSAIETSRPLIEQAGHSLTVQLTETPVYLDADPVRLAQVFSNLLNNAAKYTESGGEISLVAQLEATDAVVKVRDNGMGIPADALVGIFEMFSQVDRHMERAQGGLGIGLTLVRRLVEMHEGTVEATSDGIGHGSEFTVRIPVGTEREREIAGGEVEPKTAVQRRILVVDDNLDAARSLGMMLQLMGNQIEMAADGLAAIAAAERFRPSLILLDIGLPKLNGYEVCRRIRRESWSKGMTIVALTGWGQEEDRRRSQQAGFDHHLVKPIDLSDLTRLLAKPAN